MRQAPPSLSFALAGTFALVAGCAHSPISPNPQNASPAVLRVTCAFPAQLFIDDRFVGSTGRALAIHSGFHRIELRAEGKFSAYRDVNLGSGEQKTMDVLLRPDLDADPTASESVP